MTERIFRTTHQHQPLTSSLLNNESPIQEQSQIEDIQLMRLAPSAMRPRNILHLQRTLGNKHTSQIVNQAPVRIQRVWDKGIGPDPFDGVVALNNADWANAYYVCVNKGRIQGQNNIPPGYTSFRLSAWAPAIVTDGTGAQWTVCVSIHQFFISDGKTIVRTPHGHGFVTSWVGGEYDVPSVRKTMSGMYGSLIVTNIGKLPFTTGNLDLKGSYNNKENYRTPTIV